MQRPETLEAYRRMTNAERLAITLQMIGENEAAMLEGPAEVVRRRFELIERENNARNRAILDVLYRGNDWP